MKKFFSLISAIILLFSLTGCSKELISNIVQDVHDFAEWDENDLYVCEVNDDTSFWYSPHYMYGEWESSDEKFPISLKIVARDSQGCHISFYNDYGGRICELLIRFSQENATKAVFSSTIMEIPISDEGTIFFNNIISEFDFEGLELLKIKKKITEEKPVYQNIIDYLEEKASNNEILASEDMRFLYDVAEKNAIYITDDGNIINFNINVGPESNRQIFLNVILVFVASSADDRHTSELFLDEESIYFWDNEGKTKIRLIEVSPENDPRKDFLDFMQTTDPSGNSYIFTCEKGNFSFSGDLGIGAWNKDGEKRDIKISVNPVLFEIHISEISINSTQENLLIATFVGNTTDNCAKFKINESYLDNEIFSDQNIKEFAIVKELPTYQQ